MNRALTIFGFIILTIASQPLIACSCVGGSTIDEEFRRADLVVKGRVINKETIWLPDSAAINAMVNLGYSVDSLDKRLYGRYYSKVLIKVNKAYKGNVKSDTLTILTGVGGGDCGFIFKKRRRYILYGFLIEEQDIVNIGIVYSTSICTRTRKNNSKEIKGINKIANTKL